MPGERAADLLYRAKVCEDGCKTVTKGVEGASAEVAGTLPFYDHEIQARSFDDPLKSLAQTMFAAGAFCGKRSAQRTLGEGQAKVLKMADQPWMKRDHDSGIGLLLNEQQLCRLEVQVIPGKGDAVPESSSGAAG